MSLADSSQTWLGIWKSFEVTIGSLIPQAQHPAAGLNALVASRQGAEIVQVSIRTAALRKIKSQELPSFPRVQYLAADSIFLQIYSKHIPTWSPHVKSSLLKIAYSSSIEVHPLECFRQGVQLHS